MADIQQQSLARSIDVIKTSLKTPFIMSDEIGKSQGFMNEYAMTLHQVTEQLQGLFVTMDDGVVTGLTPLGQTLKDTVIFAMQEFGRLLEEIVVMVKDMTDEGRDFTGMITLMTMPLRLLVKLLGFLGPGFLEVVLLLKMMNGILPITNGLIAFNTMLMDKQYLKLMLTNMGMIAARDSTGKFIATNHSLGKSFKSLAMSQMGAQLGMFAFVMIIRTFAKDAPILAAAIGAITGALMGYALAAHIAKTATTTPAFMFPALVLGGMAVMAGAALAIQKMMAPPKVEDFQTGPTQERMYDTGGRIPMYDTGGPRGGGLGTRHQSVMVEPGETIIPKTQNMLSGGAGITLNIGGDIVTDNAEDFADRIAQVLPEALRRQNDAGGI